MKSNWLSDAANETADAVLEALYARKGFGQVIDRFGVDADTWSEIRTQVSDIIRHTLVTEALNAARATCTADYTYVEHAPVVCEKCGATKDELCKLDWEESL